VIPVSTISVVWSGGLWVGWISGFALFGGGCGRGGSLRGKVDGLVFCRKYKFGGC
jgi:hypothetical protein